MSTQVKYPGKDATAKEFREWLVESGWEVRHETGRERWTSVNQKNSSKTETNFEGAISIQRRREISLKKQSSLKVRFDVLLEFVKDLADHGTRFDMNPTLMGGDPIAWLHGYIREIDGDVQRRAATAVAAATE